MEVEKRIKCDLRSGNHTKSVEYRLLMRIGTHAKAGIDNQSLITGFSIIYTFAMFISKNMDYQNLSDEQFKRRFGVYKQTYRKMVESVKSVKAESNSVSKRGPKPKLSIEEQVLVTLEYWREYRTSFHIGTSGQISESTIGRIVNKTEKML
jgi:hypothetical protein